jgi:hypothetical protein
VSLYSLENEEILFFSSQSTSSDKDPHEDLEQRPTPIESEITSKKSQVTNLSNTAIIKENNTEETLLNRKSTYEPVIARRTSPPLTHGIERVSSFISIIEFLLFVYS